MKRIILYIFIPSVLSLSVSAQTYKNKLDSLITTYRIHQANKSFDNLAYVKAINKYEKLNINEQLSDSVKGLLGIAYLKISNTVKSEQVFASIPVDNLSDDQLFMYAHSLSYNGKYAEADRMMDKYKDRNPDDERALELLNALPEIEKILAEERYLVEEVDFNSEQSDFAPFVHNDELYFTSARDLDYIIKREYAWKETPYLNVMVSEIKGDDFSNPELFSSDLRSMYHDGPVCMNKDGDELFITRNMAYSFMDVNLKKKKGYNNLRILQSFKTADGSWAKPMELPFNDPSYSCGHACLSPDGKRLYFTSNMPGGLGGSDIYYVERTSIDNWGEPVNLGKDINTEGDEMFPFIHLNGNLYFASNGRVGVGGLDLYVARPKGSGFQVINMGSPINSEKDDFGIYLDPEGIHGYFSSNRSGGTGDDDIYRFTVLKNITFKRNLVGKLINKNTRQSIANAKVQIKTLNGSVVEESITDENGILTMEIDDIPGISTVVSLPDYYPYQNSFTLNEEVKEFEMALAPRPYYGIYGTVFLLPDMTPIPDVTVHLEPKPGEEEVVYSDINGNFRSRLKPDTDYNIVFTRKNFFTRRIAYSTVGKDTGYVNVNEFVELELEKAEIGKSIEIMILYDLGKWNIREDAAVELDDMVQFLKDNPDIKIELGSHTDSRGSAEFNQTLSQKRAESAVQYMVDRGVSKDRIVAKGYGETKLKNKCADGVSCSETDHQVNRRSEVTIIDM